MENENLLLTLAVVAVVFSVAGAGVMYYSVASVPGNMLNGYTIVQAQGTTNLTVSQTVAINFTVNNINFGTGYVLPGASGALLMTGGGNNTNATGWVNVTQGFVVANIGNINVSLWLSTNKTAQQFIGGTNPLYQYNVTNNASSCPSLGIASKQFNAWYNVNTSNSTAPWFGDYICRNMSYIQGNNNLTIDIKLFVPSDSLTGALGDFMTATAQNAY